MTFRKFAAATAALVAAAAFTITAFAEVDYTPVTEELKMTEFKGMAGYAGGQWLVGSDKAPMENALTIADLEAADHIEITYVTKTPVPPTLTEGDTAKFSFCYKFVTAETDGEPSEWEAYLPFNWIEYGPTPDGKQKGHTYACFDYFSFDVSETGDTMIIPTAEILASLQVDPSTILYMCQFGICCNTYDFDSDWADENEDGADYFVDITSVKLCDEPAVTTAAETTTAEETTTVEETTTEAATTTAAETTTAAATTAAASSSSSEFPTTIVVIAVIAVVVIAGAIAVIVSLNKKKK